MEQELMGDFQWTDHGASDAAIDAAEAELGVKLPADYLAVIRAFDGGEGLRDSQLQIEITMVQRTDGYCNGRAFVLA